jgi:hypothetical protein
MAPTIAPFVNENLGVLVVMVHVKLEARRLDLSTINGVLGQRRPLNRKVLRL